MTKAKQVKELIINYYDDNFDPMWKWEVEKLIPWLSGEGADIGCGTRTIWPTIKRVDIDEKVKPDVLASGDKLPFKNGELDFVIGVHAFEHFPDPRKLLSEWLRVVKVGGIVGIVHPDVTYTKKQNPEVDNPGLRENPFNKHYHEHTPESFSNLLRGLSDLPFRLIDYGVACGEWSFYVILKKV